MKKTRILAFLFFGVAHFMYSQGVLYHAIPGNVAVTTVVNNDVKAIRSINKTNFSVTARNVTNQGIVTELSAMTLLQRRLLKKKYKKNSYDRSGAFLLGAGSKLATGFATEVANKNLDKGYYLTKNKRDQMKALTLDKILLLSLVNVNKRKITAANRQEIYRLRGEVLRQFSKNDKVVTRLLLLPAAAFAVENRTELLLAIKALEISL